MIIQLKWIIMQVLMLQEKLEDKDQEIQRLKQELQQKNLMEDVRLDAAPNRNDSDEMVPKEAAN